MTPRDVTPTVGHAHAAERMMRRSLAGLVLVSTFSCGGDASVAPEPPVPLAADLAPTPDSAGNYRDSILVEGRWRWFLVHVPAGGDLAVPRPLLLGFHGGGGTPDAFRAATHLDVVADHRGFMMVFPEAYQGSWADGQGLTPAERDGVDDVAFARTLIDAVMGRYAIQPDRVFATGISSGGFFAGRLACDLSNRVAAVASVAATLSESLFARCAPPRAVPFVLMHGTDDHWVPYDGGLIRFGLGTVLSADSAAAFWARHNGCDGGIEVVYEPNRAWFDGTRVRRQTRGGCRDNATVILYTVEGGGHTWPGGYVDPLVALLLDLGLTSRDIDAGETMWDFFAQHPMPSGGGGSDRPRRR